MTIPNNHEGEDTKIRQESYTDANGNTHTQRTSETVKNSDAYGGHSQRSYQQAYLAERDQNNTSNGLLFGIVLTSLIALMGSAFWYFNQRNNVTVEKTTPVLVPVPSSSATPATSPQPQTTIIEKTREIPVLVPQQSASPPPVSSPPDINITIPPQPSTTQPSPSPQITQSPNSNSSTPTTKQNSSTNTAPPSTQNDTPDTTVKESQPPSDSGTSNTGDTTGTEGR